MLLISSITHSALAFLHSYLTVRVDDEPPLLIQSHVSTVCVCVYMCVCGLFLSNLYSFYMIF